MGAFIDIKGKRFGRLLVIKRSGTRNGQALWECMCDCGKEHETASHYLRAGLTKSCGCMHNDQVAKRMSKHGEAGTKEWKIWSGMIKRCYNPKCKSFPRYGGRGLHVSQEWKESYSAFIRDMGRCPPGMSLGRIDNDDGYHAINCEWQTSKQQARNTCKTVWLTAFGDCKPLCDWLSDPRCKCPATALPQRIRSGWGHEDAIVIPSIDPKLRCRGHRSAK